MYKAYIDEVFFIIFIEVNKKVSYKYKIKLKYKFSFYIIQYY